jgi:hypothetical protein
MGFTLDDITRLRNVGHGPITVGYLPLEVAEAMGVPVPIVHLSWESLDHINKKHPKITDIP